MRNLYRSIIVAALIVSAASPALSSGNTPSPAKSASETVYICTGPKSARYHLTPKCKGLKRCSGSIKAVPLSKAREMGRTPCHVCAS